MRAEVFCFHSRQLRRPRPLPPSILGDYSDNLPLPRSKSERRVSFLVPHDYGHRYPLPHSKHEQRGLSSGVRHCTSPQRLNLVLVVTTPSLACVDSNPTAASLCSQGGGDFWFCSQQLKATPPPLSLKHEWGCF
jgi:hypothetical protein